MSIDADYLRLIDALAAALPPVEIRGLYLPGVVENGQYRDEFGFVFLSDGSVGPFYVSQKSVLRTLRERYPRPEAVKLDPIALARRLNGGDLAERALAIGAFNALSRRLMHCAGYVPPDRLPSKEVGTDSSPVLVGVVGYFCSVVDRLVAHGNEVMVLEQQPERVPVRGNVTVTTCPEDLGECKQVLCTASVLINDTLDELLVACKGVEAFELIGPTGSGLPDGLFNRGIQSVGGIVVEDPELLKALLARGESWGAAGRKYEFGREDYPGLERLVSACAPRGDGSAE